MNAEMVYEYISNWLEKYPENTDIKVILETKELMEMCHKEMMDNQAKKAGVKSIQTAAKRIIKYAKSSPKEMMWGMFTNTLKDGSKVYCVCDGYRAVRFNDKLPLEEVDAKYDGAFNINEIVKPVPGAVEIKLPDIVDVKLSSKIRANPDDKKDKSIKPVCINKEINLWVNPKFLLDMMECLPNAKAYAYSSKSIIYFKAENGDGILCPINPKSVAIKENKGCEE
jgi:hypothetical protein